MLLNPRYNIDTSGGIPLVSGFNVTIAGGTVASDLTDFPVMIDLSDMPSSFWAGVRSDGGNIRVYESDGLTLIPHDVPFLNKAMGVGLLFAKKTISATTGAQFKIKLLDSSETAVPATDPNGRNAVWSDYEMAVVFPEKINRVDGSAPAVNGTTWDFEWKETASAALSLSQGAAFDGAHYFTTSTNTIRKYTAAGTIVTTNADPVGAMITATGNSVLNHCGAPSIIDGELWVPIERYTNSPYDDQYIGRFSLADLSLLGWMQLTGIEREASGVHYDAALGRLYVTDYTKNSDIPYYNKTTGVYLGSLSLSSDIDNMQGITELGGKYYINSEGDGVYEVEKDGTNNGVVVMSTYLGSDESVYAYDGELLLAQDNGYVRHFAKVPELQGWARLHGNPVGFQCPKTDVWTMCTSWYATPSVVQQGIIGVRAAASSSDRHSGMYDYPATKGFGMWNTSNGWLYTSPRTAPDAFTSYRAAFAQNGSAARKLSVNGAKGSAATISPRPLDAGDVIFEIGGAAGGDVGFGYYQFAWARAEYMSEAWIDADYLNVNNPGAFYSITEDV